MRGGGVGIAHPRGDHSLQRRCFAGYDLHSAYFWHLIRLRFRLADVVATSQEGFMLVRRVDAQGALLVSGDVFPGAFFEHQLRKGFPCLAYVERFAAPACRK